MGGLPGYVVLDLIEVTLVVHAGNSHGQFTGYHRKAACYLCIHAIIVSNRGPDLTFHFLQVRSRSVDVNGPGR